MAKVTLIPLTPDDREQFIRDNQEAFNYGALEEFGLRDNHFEEDREIISRETIDQSIDDGEAYRIMQDGQPVGGVVIRVNGMHGDLDLLFVSPRVHSKGIGRLGEDAWDRAMKLCSAITRIGVEHADGLKIARQRLMGVKDDQIAQLLRCSPIL